MASDSEPDYKALYLKAEERWKQEKELRIQAEERSEERWKQERDLRIQAEERIEKAEAHLRNTTFSEFIQASHNIASAHIEVQRPSKSTKESMPPPTDSEHAEFDPTYVPSSVSSSPGSKNRGKSTKSQPGCSSSETVARAGKRDSRNTDSNPGASSRKRAISQVTTFACLRRSERLEFQKANRSQYEQRTTLFCTQSCLLGLQQGGILDAKCPNVFLHRGFRSSNRHPVNAKHLMKLLKQQLDKDLDDNCWPCGDCGTYGAPLKIMDATYGYTMFGKGTTSRLWKEVSREAEVYQVLRKAQGSAVPVFLGTIDLAQFYFLHGAGEIRHMLLMGWGGENTSNLKQLPELQREISRSNDEIRSLGVIHQDLRPENILWSHELKRALIIDFLRSTLDCRPAAARGRPQGKQITKRKRSTPRVAAREYDQLRVK